MTYNKYITLISLFLLFFACKKEKQFSSLEVDYPGPDSTLLWIKYGKDAALPLMVREDNLQKAYIKAMNKLNDSVRLHYFSQLSLAYLSIKDSANFRQVNDKAILLSKEIKDSVTHAALHWDRGAFYNNYFIKDSAYYEYGQAEQLYAGLKDNLSRGRVLYSMSVIQKDIKDYTGAEGNAIKAIELLKPYERNDQLFLLYNLLGTIARSLREFEQSRDYFTKAAEYIQQIESEELKRNRINTLNNNIGNLYNEQGEYTMAVPYFSQLLNIDSLLYKNPNAYALALDNLAYSKFKSGNFSNTATLLERALKINLKENNLGEIPMNHYHLAEYYLAIEDTSRARVYINEALYRARRNKDNNLILDILKLYPLIDPENSQTYLSEYLVLNDSLEEEDRRIRNKFARIRFETDEFIAENQLLARQRQLWIGIAIGLFLLAVAVLVIISQRAKNRNLRFQQQQQEANQEIFNLMMAQSQKMEEGKQSEQKRISEELHDGILGQMNGIRMMLLGLNKKVDDNAISMRGEAIEKLQAVQEEIRTISHELNDASYQKFHNFIISIEELLKNICEAANIDYDLDYDEDLDWDALSGNIKINLYRIIQESLQNCIKHAFAKKVYLELDSTDHLLKVTLKDDGRGFDSKKEKKGIGHKNITSRVHKLNGEWKMKSKPGKGTMVTVQVPYALAQSEKIDRDNGNIKSIIAEKASS